MPTTSTGVYELVLEQTYQNQSVLNVFHYLNTLGSDDEQDKCAEAFNNDVIAALSGIQNTGVSYDNIRVANLTGELADHNEIPDESDGTLIGANVVGFVCASFRYNRVTKDTRNGAKRLTGLREEDVTSTGFEALYFADLEGMAVIFGTDISAIGGIFSPIILSKPPTEGGVYTYNTVASVTALNRTTSQNSRKVF